MSSEFMIDEFHYKNHKSCSLNYSSGQFPQRAINYSLAEQKNSPLADLGNSIAHMDQVSFLRLLRFKLAAMNVYQRERANRSSRCFWLPPLALKMWQDQPVRTYEDDEEDDEEDEAEDEDYL